MISENKSGKKIDYSTYYEGLDKNYDELVRKTVDMIIAMGIMTDGQIRRLAQRAIVFDDKSTGHIIVGWTPTQLAYITTWFTGSYLNSLCAKKQIDCVNCAKEGSPLYYNLITFRGFNQLYEKYLNKIHR